MKILLANKFFYPRGGAESVFFQHRRMLLAAGHQVVDFAMDHPENLPSPHSGFFVSGVDYHQPPAGRLRHLLRTGRLASRFVHNREAIRKLRRLIRKERPQLAHLHNIYHQLTPAIIAPLKQAGIKVVMTLHDYKLACPNYRLLSAGRICDRCLGGSYWQATKQRCQEGSLARSLLLSCEAYWHALHDSYQGVDLFCAPSRFLAETMAGRLPGERVRVVPNGVDTDRLQPSEFDEGYALYFGRLASEKGVETLLKAYQLMERPLKIAGDGPLLAELRRRYPQAGFLGHLRGEELLEVVRRASVVVVPSEWYENCSMTVLEAMALGKPVIASRLGGLPEQVDDGRTGFLFEPGNVLELKHRLNLLFLDPGMRRRMGGEGRLKVEREFSLANHFRKMRHLYASLLPKPEEGFWKTGKPLAVRPSTGNGKIL